MTHPDMSEQTTPVSLLGTLPRSPFERLRELLGSTPAGKAPIDLSIGAPRHAFPPIVQEVLASDIDGFSHYQPAHARNDFGTATGQWLVNRFALDNLDPSTHILPLAGSREGLFTIAFIVAQISRDHGKTTPTIAFPNPFYQVYASAAIAAGTQPIALPAIAANGNLPDLSALDEGLLKSLAAFYICSPANPQGAVADLDYLTQLTELARHYKFIVLADECYSEIYRKVAPPSILNAAQSDSYRSVLAFNSLSKRSNVPGLRVGLVAGDPKLIARFFSFRNVAAATVPGPLMATAAALWRDETHVTANRAAYNEKFTRAAAILGNRFQHQTPPGGFFLWLNVAEHGGSVTAAKRLWSEAGVKVVPGSYLAASHPGGFNPGGNYLRIALVGGLDEIDAALNRMISIF
jgi:N-succinyldiaminopimelate aminotransferase